MRRMYRTHSETYSHQPRGSRRGIMSDLIRGWFPSAVGWYFSFGIEHAEHRNWILMTLWTFFGTIGSTIHMSLHQLELARERSKKIRLQILISAQMPGGCMWDTVVQSLHVSFQFNSTSFITVFITRKALQQSIVLKVKKSTHDKLNHDKLNNNNNNNHHHLLLLFLLLKYIERFMGTRAQPPSFHKAPIWVAQLHLYWP